MESFIRKQAPRLGTVLLRLGRIGIWLGILPFFLLCWYAHPSADDFLTANDVGKYGHLGYLKFMYFHWAGRYTAILGWSFLDPVSYGNVKEYYGLVCFLLLLMFLAVLVLLLRNLLQGSALQAGQLWQAGAAAFLLFTYNLPNTAECFYWLTSGFNYLLPGILFMAALATLARAVAIQRRGPAQRYYLLATAILLFLVVGCNESIALPLLPTVWFFAMLESWRQRRLVGVSLVLAVSVGCAVAFLAPGNAARLSIQGSVSPGVVAGVAGAFKFMAYLLVIWLGNGILVVVTLLLVPAFAQLARVPGLPVNYLTRYPLLLTLLLPAFLAAGLFPSVWATGALSPPRAVNLLYLLFLINWYVAVYGWVFYFTHRVAPATVSWRLPGFVRWALLAWLPLTFLNDYNHRLLPGYRLSTNNSFLAYRDLFSGAAARYDAQLVARYQYLRHSSVPHPSVPALTDPPLTLLFSDITADPADWSNIAYAEFFNKKTIIAQPDTASN